MSQLDFYFQNRLFEDSNIIYHCRGARVVLGGLLGQSAPLLWPVQYLYSHSKSMIWNTSYKSDLFAVDVGFCLGYPLSPIIHLTFMDRIFRCSQVVQGFVFGGLQTTFLHSWALARSSAPSRGIQVSQGLVQEEWNGKREWCSVSSNRQVLLVG